jgi:hypothetical protein
MIEVKFAQEQMTRMIGLAFGPRAQEQRREVLRAMMESRSETILGAAVTSWIDSNPNFPKPAEMRAVIGSLNVSDIEALETRRRREEWAAAKAHSVSLQGQSEAKQDVIDLRSMLVDRLATVDQRHADSWGGDKERSRIKGEIKRMIELIDRGKTVQQIVGAEPYHGEF